MICLLSKIENKEFINFLNIWSVGKTLKIQTQDLIISLTKELKREGGTSCKLKLRILNQSQYTKVWNLLRDNGYINVMDGMICMNGTTNVPKSILHYSVDKVRQESQFEVWCSTTSLVQKVTILTSLNETNVHCYLSMEYLRNWWHKYHWVNIKKLRLIMSQQPACSNLEIKP